MPKVLVICGATATGKTSLAVECAKKLNTEIISADSQLIYKDLNIGTAKPTAEEMRGVKHHMIDVVEPDECYSVAEYAQTAGKILKDLLNAGKTPIICGGTGFYINSLLFDFGYGNAQGDQKIRQKYQTILESKGKDELFRILQQVDSETAQRLHPNDTKRVIRALEIYEVSGKKKSEQDDKLIPKYDYTAVAVDFPREELYRRIALRVDNMMRAGLVEEVKNLLERGINKNMQSMQAIGYKEVIDCLNNGDLRSTMSDIIKLNTRHYAKRQITFFKKLPKIEWISPDNASADKIIKLMDE